MGRPEGIAEAFLAAAVEPQLWLGALERLASATGSDHAQLIGIGPSYSFGFNWVSDMDASAHAAADRPELLTPSANFRVASGIAAPLHSIIAEDRYASVQAQLTDDAYLDLCSDLQIPHGCQTTLLSGPQGLVGFALLRSHHSGPTDAVVRATFADACRSAGAAVALQVALERDGHRLVAGSFEAMGTACFVLDRAMIVRATTLPAEALLQEGELRLVDGRLSLAQAAEDRRLAGALNAIAGGAVPAASLVTGGAGMLTLRVHRLPEREWNMGFAPFAIVIAKRPGGANAADLALIRASHGLTASEAEIALLLRAGRGRAEICTLRGITRETLRSHLRSLFGKLGVSRETEAIHLLHAMLG